MAEELIRKYEAFISYRHLDNVASGRKWADWLHQALETFEVPEELAGRHRPDGSSIPHGIYPVFQDEKELPADADLAKPIRRALDHSRTLIVLCSPRAVESKYVSEEIIYFKQLGRSHRILAMILAGEPNADDPGKVPAGIGAKDECFPLPLRHPLLADGTLDTSQRIEPLAADMRLPNSTLEGYTSASAYRDSLRAVEMEEAVLRPKVKEYEKKLNLAFLKVVAGVLDLPVGELTLRDQAYRLEKARRRQRQITLVAAILAVFATAAVIAGVQAILQRNEASHQRQQAEQNAIAARAQAAEAERQRATAASAVAQIDFDKASSILLAGTNDGRALAHLAHAARLAPSDPRVSERMRSWFLTSSRSLNTSHLTVGMEQEVGRVTFSPNTSRVAIGNGGASVQLYDVQSGKKMGAPLSLGSVIRCDAFSRDGNWLVTSSESGEVRVWNSRDGTPASPIIAEHEQVWARFRTDLRTLETIAGPFLGIYDIQSGKRLDQFTAAPAFSWGTTAPDESRFLQSDHHVVQMIDAKTGEPVGAPAPLASDSLTVWSSDSSILLVGIDSEQISAYDARAGRLLYTLPAKGDFHRQVQFSPHGDRLVICDEQQIILRDAATGQPIHPGYQFNKRSLAKSPISWNGNLAVVEHGETEKPAMNQIEVISLETGKVSFTVAAKSDFEQVAFSADGLLLASKMSDSSVHLWDTSSGVEVNPPLQGGGNTLDFSPDGRWLDSSDGGLAWRWDIHAPRLIPRTLQCSEAVRLVRFAPDSRHAVMVMTDGRAQIWDLETAHTVGVLAHGGGIRTLEYSPNGKSLLSLSRDGGVRLWDAATGRLEHICTLPAASALSASFVRGQPRAITWKAPSEIQIWDMANNRAIGPQIILPTVPEADLGDNSTEILRPKRASICATGDRLAVYRPLGFSPQLTLWDLTSGRQVGEEHTYAQQIYDLQFSPDGRRLGVSSKASGVDLLDAADGHQLAPELEGEYFVDYITFSPDSTKFVYGSRLMSGVTLDAESGRRVESALSEVHVLPHIGFTSGNQILAVNEDGSWSFSDVRSGARLTELFHEPVPGMHLSEAVASPDGRWVITVPESKDGKSSPEIVRLWNVAELYGPVPAWMADYAEAVGGCRIDPDFGSLGDIQEDATAVLQKAASQRRGADAAFAQWLLAPPKERKTAPGTADSLRDRIRDALKDGREESIREAYLALPGGVEAGGALAQFLPDVNRVKDFFREAAAQEPFSAEMARLAGVAFATKKEAALARAEFKRAQTLEPSASAPWASEAAALEDWDDLPGALATWNGAIERAPEEFEYLQRRADLHFKMGDRPGGEADYAAAIAAGSKEEHIPRLYGWALLGQNSAKEARIQFEKALTLTPDPSSDLLAGLAAVRFATGDEANAVEAFHELIYLEPSFADDQWLAKLGWPIGQSTPLRAARDATERKFGKEFADLINRSDE